MAPSGARACPVESTTCTRASMLRPRSRSKTRPRSVAIRSLLERHPNAAASRLGRRMARAYIGTSGFSYPEWRPSFYPSELKPDGFLAYYAAQLPAVEIDRTFYRMPNGRTLEAWRGAVPDGFKFKLKASQKITHFERLKLPSEAHDYLAGVLPKLGDRLGVHFYQLPPNFRRNDERLETFLANLPRGIPSAFEFRHESWFDPAVYRML